MCVSRVNVLCGVLLSAVLSIACDDSAPPVEPDSGSGGLDGGGLDASGGDAGDVDPPAIDAGDVMPQACDFPVTMTMTIDDNGDSYHAAVCDSTDADLCQVTPGDDCSTEPALYFSIFLNGDERMTEFVSFRFGIDSNSSGTVNQSTGRLQGFEEDTDVTVTMTQFDSDIQYEVVFRYDGEQVTIKSFGPVT